MKKLFLCTTMFLLIMSGMAQARLTTIGTATYDGSNYNLIWDDDNNGKSLVWLDYTNDGNNWNNQRSWASSLNTALTINLYAGYTVDWGGSSWRLPSTVDDGGPYQYGYDGTTTHGYNITSSEMGHLYYEELGNFGYYDTSGNEQSGWGLKNIGEFQNLIASWYWFGEEFIPAATTDAWIFGMYYGNLYDNPKVFDGHGIAVRSGQVTVSSVPVPGAILLLSAGLLWVAGLGRKSRRAV